MSTKWQDALHGHPWSFSALMHSQSHVHDTDGRPLGEIRAPTQAKVDVPMVLKACPYRDARKGYEMNVSALEQMTGHLDWVLHDVVAFRRKSRQSMGNWDGMLAGVLDQLSGPIRFLLSTANEGEKVPARLAVGHKLAAGYFGVLTEILKQDALGRRTPVTIEGFLSEVERQNALFGASEVCAGPPNLIRRCTAAWLASEDAFGAVLKPIPDATQDIPQQRVDVALALVEQVRLGLAFGLYDEVMESHFLRRWGAEVDPHNPYIEKRLALARMKAADRPRIPPRVATHLLPRSASGEPSEHPLFEIMNEPRATIAPGSALQLYSGVLRCRKGALRADNCLAVDLLAHDIANYLEGLRRLYQLQWSLEMRIRKAFSLPLDTPVKLGSLQRPLPAFLDWIEALLGYKVICVPSAQPKLTLRNHLNQEQVPTHSSPPPALSPLTAVS